MLCIYYITFTRVYYCVLLHYFYLRVVYRYVFIDLYIGSRGVATIWCFIMLFVFYNVPTMIKIISLLLFL